MAGTTATGRRRRRLDVLVSPPVRRSDWLDSHCEQWSAEGLVSDEQCAGITAFERRDVLPDGRAPPAPPALTLANEAVIYLGSAFALAGGGVVVARSWGSLAHAARVSIGLAIAVVGFLAGAVLIRRRDPSTSRLASYAWTIGTGGVAMASGVQAHEWAWTGHGTALAIGVPVLLIGVALWRNRPRPLQLLTALVGLAIASGALVDLADIEVWLIGIAILICSAVFVAGSLRGRVEPCETTIFVGCLAALIGAATLVKLQVHLGGIVPAIVAVGVVALALSTGRTPLLVLGVLAFLQALNATITTTLDDPVAALVLTALGVVTVSAVIIRTLSRPSRMREPDSGHVSAGSTSSVECDSTGTGT